MLRMKRLLSFMALGMVMVVFCIGFAPCRGETAEKMPMGKRRKKPLFRSLPVPNW